MSVIFLKSKGLITLLAGIILLAIPKQFGALLGVDLTDGGALVARLLGAVYAPSGLNLYRATRARDIDQNNAVSYAGGEFVAAIVCLVASAQGILNPLGWGLGVAYLIFALGFIRVARDAAS